MLDTTEREVRGCAAHKLAHKLVGSAYSDLSFSDVQRLQAWCHACCWPVTQATADIRLQGSWTNMHNRLLLLLHPGPASRTSDMCETRHAAASCHRE